MTTKGAPAMTSSTLQPNAEEYAVFLNRFKLLNLVQRVAHNDVMELVETVGLDALSYKGVRLPFAGGGGDRHSLSPAAGTTLTNERRRDESLGVHREYSARRGTRRVAESSGWDRRRLSPSAAASAIVGGYRSRRTNQDLRAEAATDAVRDAEDRDSGRRERGLRQRRNQEGYGFRSRPEREAYYARLAEPKQKLNLDQEFPPVGPSAIPFDDAAYAPSDNDGRRNAPQSAPFGGPGHADSRSEEDTRRLFAEFLRTRYGGNADEGAGGRPLPVPSYLVDTSPPPPLPASGTVRGGSDGSPPPWRRLQPYRQATEERTGDPSGAALAFPPSSTWPPQATGNEDSLVAFYRAQQQLPFQDHFKPHSSGVEPSSRRADDDVDRDAPSPEYAAHTAPRNEGSQQGKPGAQPLPHSSSAEGAPHTYHEPHTTSQVNSPAQTLATRLSPPLTAVADGNNRGSLSEDSSQLVSLVKEGRDHSAELVGPSSNSRGGEDDATAVAIQGGLSQPHNGNSGDDHRPQVPRLPLTPRDRVASAPTPTSETPLRVLQDPNSESLSFQSQAQLSTSSALGGGVSRVLGGSRGLAPKAKPKGALDSPRVPMSVIQHAASVLSHQQQSGGSGPEWPMPAPVQRAATESDIYPSLQQHQQRHSPNSQNRSVVFASTTTNVPRARDLVADAPSSQSGPVMRQGRSWTPHPQPPPASSFPQQQSVSRVEDSHDSPRQQPPPPSLVAIAESIDKMLRDHHRILEEVVHDNANKTAATDETGGSSEKSDRTPSDEKRSSGSGSSIDEMLVFSQLQRKVDAMDRDMARIQSTAVTRRPPPGYTITGCTSGSSSDGYADDLEHTPAQTASATVKKAPQPRRIRGTIPEAVVRRLLSYQVEQNECIAYNEKLWNTSTVSSYAFAQRLTNGLLEDCLDEVTQEVGSIMDEYVDGLADYELQ